MRNWRHGVSLVYECMSHELRFNAIILCNYHLITYIFVECLVPSNWNTKLLPQFFMMTSSNGIIFRITGPLCGEFTGPGEFPTQRPVTRSFGVFFDLRLNKRLSKQPWGWWFETPSWSLWRHCNVFLLFSFVAHFKVADLKVQRFRLFPLMDWLSRQPGGSEHG